MDKKEPSSTLLTLFGYLIFLPMLVFMVSVGTVVIWSVIAVKWIISLFDFMQIKVTKGGE